MTFPGRDSLGSLHLPKLGLFFQSIIAHIVKPSIPVCWKICPLTRPVDGTALAKEDEQQTKCENRLPNTFHFIIKYPGDGNFAIVMKKHLVKLSVGLVLLAGANKTFGQFDGLDDRYRTQDSFREPDNTPNQAFQPYEPVKTVYLRPTSNSTNFTIMAQPVSVKLPQEGWIFSLSVQPKLGYESNPLHGQTEQGSMLYGVDESIGLSYTTNGYSVGVAHSLKTQFYDDNRLANGTTTSAANSIQNKLSLVGSYLVTPDWVAKVTGIGTHTIVNNKAANQSLGVSPSTAFKWPVTGYWAASSLAYAYARFNDLSVQPNPALNDQANEHTLSMDNSLFSKGALGCVSNWISSVTTGYAHKWHDSDGSLRQYQSDSAYIDFAGPVLSNTNLQYDFTYTHTWKYYDALGTAAVGVARLDNVDDVQAQLDYTLLYADTKKNQPKVDLILSYDFANNQSNKATVNSADQTVFAALKVAF